MNTTVSKLSECVQKWKRRKHGPEFVYIKGKTTKQQCLVEFLPQISFGISEHIKIYSKLVGGPHYLLPYPETEYKDKPAEIYSL